MPHSSGKNMKIKPVPAVLLICALAATAVVIYLAEGRLAERKAAKQRQAEAAVAAQKEAEAEQERKKEAAQKAASEERERQEAKKVAELKAAQDALIAHDRFIAQYENTNVIKTPGVEMIAVVCKAEDATMNHAVSAALVNRFKTNDVELVSSFFRPTLITEGVFDSIFNGSGDMFRKLELAKYVDGLLLARQEVQYSTNGALNNVITASMHLEVVTLAVSGQIQSQGWKFAANGVGFRPADARMQAEDRILKQIADDATMSFIQVNTHQ